LQTKIYVVTEVRESGGEDLLALRLTHGAAREIAKQKGGRRVTKCVATKDTQLIAQDPKL